MQLTTTLYYLTSVSSIMSSFQNEASYKDFKAMEEEFEKKIAEKKSTDNLTKYEIAEDLLEKRVENRKDLENNIKKEFENKKELYLEKIKENYGLIQGFELKNFNIDFEEYDDKNFKKGLILEMKKMLLEDNTSFEAFEKHFQSIIYCGKPLLDFSVKYSLDFIETLCEVLLGKGENYINKYEYHDAFLYYFIYSNIFKDEKEKRKKLKAYKSIKKFAGDILSSDTIIDKKNITRFICIRDIKKIIKLFLENQSEENSKLFLAISRCSDNYIDSDNIPRSYFNFLYPPLKVLKSDMWNFFNYYKKLFDWDFAKSKDEFLQTMNNYSERQIMGCCIKIKNNNDFHVAQMLNYSNKYSQFYKNNYPVDEENEQKLYIKEKGLYLSDQNEPEEINNRFYRLELDNFILLLFKLLFCDNQNEFFKRYSSDFESSRIETINFHIKSNNEIENNKEMLMKYFYFIDIDIDLFNEYRRILLGINEQSNEKNIEKTKIRENLKYLVDNYIQKEDPNEIIECLAKNIEILILYCFLNCYKMNFYYKRMGGYKKLSEEILYSDYFIGDILNGKILKEKYFVFIELFRWKINKEMEYKLFKKIFFELKDVRIVFLAIYAKNEYFFRYLRGGNIYNEVSGPSLIDIILFINNHLSKKFKIC